MTQARSTMSIAVAIPCYKVTQHVLEVIRAVPASVARIYAVDDACPEGSGAFIQANCTDPRVQVLFNPENRGVGGAVVTAYQQAIADGMDIVVKIDGDGQMDPALLPQFVRPIIAGRADYTKGNRFFRPESVRGMPPVRLFGNAVLSFMTKLSCGYWTIMDPTNGYTAVHTSVLRELPLDKLERRYFFETDMLFRLNTLRAVVRDVPMDSVYADEESNLKIGSVLPEFLKKHASRLLRRYAYSYFVRDFNAGSIYSIFGLLLLAWGSLFGARQWIHSALGRPAGHQRHGHAGRASRHGGYPVPGGLPAPRREQRADGTTEPATGGRARAGYGPPSRGPAVTRMSSAVPAPAEDASPTLPWIFCGLVLPMILYAARMVGVLVQTEIPFDSLHTYLPPGAAATGRRCPCFQHRGLLQGRSRHRGVHGAGRCRPGAHQVREPRHFPGGTGPGLRCRAQDRRTYRRGGGRLAVCASAHAGGGGWHAAGRVPVHLPRGRLAVGIELRSPGLAGSTRSPAPGGRSAPCRPGACRGHADTGHLHVLAAVRRPGFSAGGVAHARWNARRGAALRGHPPAGDRTGRYLRPAAERRLRPPDGGDRQWRGPSTSAAIRCCPATNHPSSAWGTTK